MNAWLSVDFVAKRYGTLPSTVLREGDSLDLKIANLAVQYENYLHNKSQGSGAELTQDDMQGMLDRVKQRAKDAKKTNK
jgi:hypothetical protein